MCPVADQQKRLYMLMSQRPQAAMQTCHQHIWPPVDAVGTQEQVCKNAVSKETRGWHLTDAVCLSDGPGAQGWDAIHVVDQPREGEQV